ncbi:MAG: hypothetical protein ACP5OP_07580 [Leptospirillia bacterium]
MSVASGDKEEISVFIDGPDSELRIPRGADLSQQDHIEIPGELPGQDLPHRNGTSRDRQDKEAGSPP